MPSVIQRSFAGGEISPQLNGRADQAKYATGLKTCRNAVVQKHGSVVNRAGFEFIDEVKDSTKAVALMPFVFNDDQTYLIEVGDGYLRFYQDGARLTTSAAAWSNATAYEVGDLVLLAGVTYYCILAHTNHTPANATYWYALTGTIFEIPTPYAAADLFDLQYVQSADVVTIVHPTYAPRELARHGQTDWTLTAVAFAPTIDPPANILVANDGTAGTSSYSYVVTAVSEDGEESLPGTFNGATSFTISSVALDGTGIDKDQLVVTTTIAHGLGEGAHISISGVLGMTELNGHQFVVHLAATDGVAQFHLRNSDGSTYAAYVSGGTVLLADSGLTGVAAASSTHPISLSWDSVADAKEYNIYRRLNGVYGFIGSTTELLLSDEGDVTPDTTICPPSERIPFLTTDNYPSAVSYIQQRQAFANTVNAPEKTWLSQIGHFGNLSERFNLTADDAFSFTANGQKVNRVRHLRDIGKLVLFTDGGIWTVAGDASGALGPTTANPHQETYSAVSGLPPIIIDNTALYVKKRSASVCDLRYDFSADGYPTRDLSIFSTHLTSGYTIVSWCYAESPDAVVWAVRDDGVLLALTYVREHEVWGWHRHDTGDGDLFEAVMAIPEGNEDAVYAVVNRTINGSTKRYIERLHTRVVDDVAADSFFVDSGLSFDGTNTGSTTLTLSGGTTWSVDEDLTLTASGAQFVAGDVGNQYRLTQGDLTLRLEVTVYTNPTHVTVRALRSVVVDADGDDYTVFRTGARTTWARAVDQVSGLSHLEGRTVAICADGAEETQAVVTAGVVSVATPAAILHVGLPITADVELLDLEDPNGETLVGRKKLIVAATALVRRSAAFSAGPDEDHLKTCNFRDTEDWDEPTALETDAVSIALSSTWDNNGRIFIRQTAPLPLELLAVVRHGELGGKR